MSRFLKLSLIATLALAFIALLPASSSQANTFLFITFDGTNQDVPAEFLSTTDLTFSATVAEAYKVDSTTTLVTLQGNKLAGPSTAQLIIEVETFTASAFSFRYATPEQSAVRIEVFNGASLELTRNVIGHDLGAGFYEGTALFGNLTFDRIVITPPASTLFIDDINIVQSGGAADGRLNPVLAEQDQTGAIYCRVGGIEILNSIDGTAAEGDRELFVTDARVASAGIPASGAILLQRSSNRAYELYRLDTGEFQLNGPGLEAGMFYSFVFDGCASRIPETTTTES